MEETQTGFCSLSSKVILETTDFFVETFSFLSSLANNPLFSVFVALYTLILLYFPKLFLDLIFSPILISTGILLSTLLRLGSIQRAQNDNSSKSPTNQALVWVSWDAETDTKTEHKTETDTDTHTDTEIKTIERAKPFFSEAFLEWNVRAPLEVIYEDYEGEEKEEEEDEDRDEEGNDCNEKEEIREMGINGTVSLARFYPESDSGSSSDGEVSGIGGWDSPQNICFRWEEEEEKEGLIEIQLDGKRSLFDFQVEEENLIEIEIGICENRELSGE